MHTVNPQHPFTTEYQTYRNEADVYTTKNSFCKCGRPVNGDNTICYVCYHEKTGLSVADYLAGFDIHITIDARIRTVTINGESEQIYDPAIDKLVQKMVFLWGSHRAEKLQSPKTPAIPRYYEYKTTQAYLDYANSVEFQWFTS